MNQESNSSLALKRGELDVQSLEKGKSQGLWVYILKEIKYIFF